MTLTRRTEEHSAAIPEAFPTMPADRFVSAYFSPKCDVMLQIEMFFPDRLDRDILCRALDLALDAEPVLGCRFSIEGGSVVWRRLDTDKRDNFKEFSSETEYVQYKNKIVHEACDAGGAKDVAYLVASLYRALRKDPNYRPIPNFAGSRGFDQVLQYVPWYAYPQQWMNAFQVIASLAFRPRSYNPLDKPVSDLRREYLVRAISGDTVSLLKVYGKQANAKLNDILLTGFIRAFSATGWDRTSQLRCGWTIDFRKWYLPGGKAGAIANLSGIEILNLGRDRGRTFRDTLQKVAASTEKRRRNWIGLTHYPGMFRMLEKGRYDRMRKFFVLRQEIDIKKGGSSP